MLRFVPSVDLTPVTAGSCNAAMFAFDRPMGRAIRAPLRLIPKTAVVPILSGPNRGLRWVAGSFNHGCWLGTYERRCAEFIAAQIRPGATVFDVGANVGYYTLLMARRAGRVFAFEPNPRNVGYLRQHLALNGITNAEVVEAAVSDKTGLAHFSGDGATGRLSSTGHGVKTVTLDDYPTPDFVKMDIEGAELSGIRGSSRIMRERSTSWFIALHGDALHELPRSLAAGGYCVRWITPEEISVTA